MKILLKMTLLVVILFGIYNVALESLRFSRDQVRILNAKALSKSLQFYYLQQGTYPPSGLNENVCYYLYNRKLINKPMRDPAYMSNVIFLEKNLYLVKKFFRGFSELFNTEKLKKDYSTIRNAVVTELNEIRSNVDSEIEFFNKDFNLILDDDKKVSPQPLVSFERIIDNEGIPIECSINYVSDNVNNHFEISIYLESKFSKDRMKWDGGDDPQRYEIGNYLKLNTSSTVIDGNLTANSNNISMIQ